MNGGLHIGWVSPSLAKLQASDTDLPVTPDQGSWIASCFRMGAGLGSFISGMLLVNRYGRRRTLLSTTIPSTIAWIIIRLATNYWLLIIARYINTPANDLDSSIRKTTPTVFPQIDCRHWLRNIISSSTDVHR